jgi:hypothetical protein
MNSRGVAGGGRRERERWDVKEKKPAEGAIVLGPLLRSPPMGERAGMRQTYRLTAVSTSREERRLRGSRCRQKPAARVVPLLPDEGEAAGPCSRQRVFISNYRAWLTALSRGRRLKPVPGISGLDCVRWTPTD